MVAAWKKLRPGLPFDREGMEAISAARKMRDKAKSRRRHLRRALTWDGITDDEILDRDGWRCQIPGCKRRPIRKDLAYPHPRSKSIDHILPLVHGGDDIAVNKRAAHLICNVRRSANIEADQLLLFGSIRDAPLSAEITGTVRERREPKPKVPKPPKVRQCACGNEFSAKQAGKSDRCPWCISDVATRGAAMRQEGYLWREIADELGYANTGAIFAIVKKYGGPVPPTWGPRSPEAALQRQLWPAVAPPPCERAHRCPSCDAPTPNHRWCTACLCTGLNAKGQPCGNRAVLGDKCEVHGRAA